MKPQNFSVLINRGCIKIFRQIINIVRLKDFRCVLRKIYVFLAAERLGFNRPFRISVGIQTLNDRRVVFVGDALI